MFTSRSKFSIVAISVLGLAGWTAPGPGDQDEAVPVPANSPQTVAEPGPGGTKQPEVVLLSDGRIVRGLLSEEDTMIVVTQPIGTMKFPKKRVEKVFASIRDVYTYKLEQLPENDVDERIKLAKWCLAQKMEPEARQQLEAILEHSPKHPEAKAMLVSLDQAQARLAMRGRDPAVRQTAGEEVRRLPGDRPGVLDSSLIPGAFRGMGISDFPVIFDLPQAQAVKRFDEFGRYVHPVLQTYCARCHNDQYDGTFQLVSFKSKGDRTPAALRANLDATLRLIDRDNPAHSVLLSSSLRPHGRGPNPRPIFKGSNDGAYQILATWINRLQGRKTADGVVPASMSSAGSDPGESFGRQRGPITSDSDTAGPAIKHFVTGPVENKSLPPLRRSGPESTRTRDRGQSRRVPASPGGRRRPAEGRNPPAKPALARPDAHECPLCHLRTSPPLEYRRPPGRRSPAPLPQE